MKLKKYQVATIDVLQRYLERARVEGSKNAYERIVAEPQQALRLGKFAGAYKALEGLPDTPYVCLRLPTGGGKTILAAHSISVVAAAWMYKQHPMVLWLVPSNTIRLQTAEALKNTSHPYRQVLDAAFEGRVRIFDIGDFTQIRPQDLRSSCVVVVATIQTLRVQNTEGRKVYSHHEELEPHFSAIPKEVPGLEKLEDGSGIKFSFANLMHLHRPLMIVDEAHNAVTGLTRELQHRVNPAVIVEFTATPRPNSNILHSVKAQELKSEEMVKLPIVLAEKATWQGAVTEAIAQRARLAKIAALDSAYIRPIVLFQAQPKDQEVTVEVLKKHLIETEQIDESKIVVATGEQRQLDGIDLFDRSCPVEFVITVEALKEGWDCSFAYVFCSASRIQSAVAVEQLLGRVLRMPYAQLRSNPALNKAYAFLSEPTAAEAAKGLTDKLVQMGFDETEAKEMIEPVQRELGGLFGVGRPKRVVSHKAKVAPEAAEKLSRHEGVDVTATGDGEVEIVIAGPISEEAEKEIVAALPETDRAVFKAKVAKHRVDIAAAASPAEKGAVIRIPALSVEIQGVLELADTDLIVEAHSWSLKNHSALFTDVEFSIREEGRTYEIDLDGDKIKYKFTSEEEQFALDVDVKGWTDSALVLWLDKQVHQPDINQAELLRWLSELVQHLTVARSIHISALMRCKFILARKVRDRLVAIRQSERNSAYQRCLFAPEAKVEVVFAKAFEFKDGMYADQRKYDGRWKPTKHFLGASQVPEFDGVDDGEELRCAEVIDSLPSVKYWMRNVSKHPDSFWLPTSTDRFYPDFVAELTDGRLLVAEYKGAHIANNADTAEKRNIGALWERKSSGKGLFLIVEKMVGENDIRKQLLEKVGLV